MIKSINIFIQNTNQKHTPKVSQGGSGQVTGVMKLPCVEHLKTVPYYGDVHVLTLKLRSTAQGVNLPRNPIPLLIHIYGAVFHFKISSGCLWPTYMRI